MKLEKSDQTIKILSKLQTILDSSKENPVQIKDNLSSKLKELAEINNQIDDINKKIKPYEILDFYEKNMGNLCKVDLKNLMTIYKDVKCLNIANSPEEVMVKHQRILKSMFMTLLNKQIYCCKHFSEQLPTDINFKNIYAILDLKSRRYVKAIYLKERKHKLSLLLEDSVHENIDTYKAVLVEELYRFCVIFEPNRKSLLELKLMSPKEPEFYFFAVSLLENFLDSKNLKEIEALLKILTEETEKEENKANIEIFIKSKCFEKSGISDICLFFIFCAVKRFFIQKFGIFEEIIEL